MISRDVIIIGAGPAGMACALQLKRFGMNPLIIEQNKVGGLLLNANLVENYMGFPHGIRGAELVRLMKKQVLELGIEIKIEKALNIDKKEALFIIKTDKSNYCAKYLVIATGTKPRKLKYPDVCYDAYKLKSFKGKKIAIIGSGDAAFDYALNLCKNNMIWILNRSDKLKCISLLKQRTDKEPNIKYLPNICLEDIREEFDYVLGAIGREPNFELVDDKIENAPNIYLIGDIKNGMRRQTAIAVGDGLRVAMDIYENNF